jgi:hypothetical protein
MTMNKSARPSLYSGTSSGNTAEVFNILGVLEPPRRSGSSLIRRAALVLMVVFVSAGVFVAANNFPELRSRAIALVDSAFSRDEAPGKTAAAPAIPVLAAAEPQDAQASVAKIVSDEPVDPRGPGSLDLTAQANIGLPLPSPLPELAAKSIMDAGSLSPSAAVNASPDRQPAAAQSAAEALVNKPAPLEKARTVQAARHATSKPRPHHTTARRKDDRDVDLIAALLTRVSAADTVEKSAKSTGTPKNRNTPARQKNSSTVGSSDKPNRDLVLNQAHVSLSTLVRRCRTLGLVEGELCRLRICSGSWGKDPACPASGLPPEN